MSRCDDRDSFVLELGTRIRALRLGKNMSLEQLAFASGISKGHLSSIELGRTAMNVCTANKIARGLGMTLVTLFFFPEESALDEVVDELRAMSAKQVVTTAEQPPSTTLQRRRRGVPRALRR